MYVSEASIIRQLGCRKVGFVATKPHLAYTKIDKNYKVPKL